MLTIHPTLPNFVRPSDHSTFSPSSTDIWTTCPFSIGWVRDHNIESIDTDDSKRGTLAHSYCEAVFHQKTNNVEIPVKLTMDLLAWEKTHPGDFEEIRNCAEVYSTVVIHWLVERRHEIGNILWWGLERGIPIFPEEGCFGTGDCVIVAEKATIIIDYKHGKKPVDADSEQLLSYAGGVARYLQNIPEDYQFISVVVQPRVEYAPKEARFSLEAINHHLTNIWNAIQASKKPDLEPCEGSHCFWCPAKRTPDLSKKCPAVAGRPLKAAQENFGQFLSDMNAPVAKLSDANPKRDAAMLKIMALMPLLEQITKDAEAEFLYRISQGEHIPGLSEKQVIGKREWAHDDIEAVAAHIKKYFPHAEPLRTVTSLKPLGEIEKMTGKNSMDPLTLRKVTKKLDVHDDKRKEVLGQLAAYGNLTNNIPNEDGN